MTTVPSDDLPAAQGRPALSPALAGWVGVEMGAPVVAEVFTHHSMSLVVGVRLVDGRVVVVKARPDAVAAAACVAGQRLLHQDGFPCPEPLTDVEAVDELAVHAEAFVDAGGEAPVGGALIDAMAPLLVDLVRRCRRLRPAGFGARPMWLAWDHPGGGVWPDDPVEDPPDWLTETAGRCRERLAGVALEEVAGHCDWEAQNMGWRDGRAVVVHDWDSLVVAPEAALAGAAAATFPSGADAPVVSALGDTAAFLDAYQRAAGRRFGAEEIEVAWAAGTWLAAHNARMELRYCKPGTPVLTRLAADHGDRLRLAGA